MGNTNTSEPISDIDRLEERLEDSYKLKWNEFNANVLNSLRHLQDEKDFIDVTISCDGYTFVAHQVVLSACSPYFHTLLEGNPCEHPVIVIPDIRRQEMEALLKFIYYGEVHINEEQLSEFLKTAEILQIYGLTNASSKNHIIDTLKEINTPNTTDDMTKDNCKLFVHNKKRKLNDVKSKNSKFAKSSVTATTETKIPEMISQVYGYGYPDDIYEEETDSTNLENAQRNMISLVHNEDETQVESIVRSETEEPEFISIDADAIISSMEKHNDDFSNRNQFYMAVRQQSDTQNTKPNQMKTKIWNRRDYCVFCHRFVTHFSRHLYRHHPHEESVTKIMTMDKRSAVRKKMIEMLRLKGNSQGRNDLVMVPKSHTVDNEKRKNTNEMFFCMYCKKTLSKNILYKHTKYCEHNPKNKL